MDTTKKVTVLLDGKILSGFKKVASSMGAVVSGTTKSLGRFHNTVKQNTAGVYKFNSALLGTMFFGMGLQRVFGGMLGPAAELFGIFDIWGVTMQMVFLPVMTSLFDVFLPFATMLMNLSEPVKMVIGVFVTLAALFGTILFLVSSVALGVGALMFAGIGLGTMFAITGVILAVIIGVFMVVAGIIDIVKGKWEGLGLILIGIGVILFIFIGWWALIPIAIGAAIYLIIKYWSNIATFFSNIWKFISGIFDTWWGKILISVLMPFIAIILVITKNWDKITTFFSDLWTGVVKIFSGAWDGISGFVTKIIDGAKKAIDWLKDLIFWQDKKDTKTSSGKDSGTTKSGSTKKVNDFVWRPGQGVVSISPNDTLIGFKGAAPNMGGGITVNQTISITGGLKDEVERMIRDNNRNLVDEIRRLTGIRG